MAMTALSIDMLLPAFPELRAHVGLPNGSTDVAQVITFYFVGLAAGLLVFGPLSDRWGRLPLLRAGLAVMLLGTAATVLAGSLTALLVGRLIWGFGAAAPRAIALAIVRDRMHGDEMAKTMSMLMAIFLVVPVIAPSVGALLLGAGNWRLLVGFQATLILGVLTWTLWMPETLDRAGRRSTSLPSMLRAARFVATNRVAMSFALGSTALFGVGATYIGTAEAIFDEVFDAAALFPVMFGAVAASMAVGSISGSRLVPRVGMLRVLKGASIAIGLGAAGLLVLALASHGAPPMWAFVIAMAVLLVCMALLTPACNTAAMGPLGQMAGLGAAIIGVISTAGGAVLGGIADRTYDGTIIPFAIAIATFVATGLAAIAFGLGDPAMHAATQSATAIASSRSSVTAAD